MADYYVQTVIHQTIPESCMTPLERWLLTHFFQFEDDGADQDPPEPGLYLFAEESPSDMAEIDDEYRAAIRSEPNQELVKLVADAINDDTVQLDVIGYEYVLQQICKRHPGRLPYVVIEQSMTCSKMRPDGFGGAATVITPDAIDGISTHEWAHKRLVELGLEKQ